MLVLGINGGFRSGYQDTSAVLVRDGKVTRAVEEERFTRVKHAPGQIPEKSIDWILKKENISLNDIKRIAVHGSTFGEEFSDRLKKYFQYYFKHCPPIFKFHHHLAHSASAYYASGFDQSMILTVDNSGDGCSTQTAIGSKGKIKVLKRWKRPQSLGIFYSMMTQFCGFRKDRDEYKLMGLSAYGDPSRYDLNKILSIKEGNYELNEDFLFKIQPGRPQAHKQEMLFSKQLESFLKVKARSPFSPITKEYKDLAASSQKHLEKALIEIVTDLYKETKIRNLCLSGGVALNCLANQKIAELDFIDNIYIQPASSDAGISLGAAYLACLDLGDEPQAMDHVYLGPSFDNSSIFDSLKLCQVPFTELKEPAQKTAELIAQKKIVGWFQGAMEFGPRALGARSILASPFEKNMKDILNSKIKFREEFRPFGPSLLIEEKNRILESNLKELPYMTVTSHVKESWKDKLAPIVHKDGTSRPQTLTQKSNPLFWDCLKKLKELSGAGIVINTSFNTNLEPIVNTPKEALASFYGSGMDALVIGNFLLEKEKK